MLVKQIADILNETFFPEAVGQRAEGDESVEIFTDDLSNVGTLGTQVVATTTINGNLNQALKTIYDKVGQTIYADESYSSGGFDIVGTDAEYGSVLEKIRVEAPDFDENEAWNFEENGGSTHEEMFGYHAVDTNAKYFNSLATFRTKPYTITEKQFKSAFTSRSDVLRFIGAIEARVISKRNLARNILSHKAVVGLLAEKLKTGKNVYKLLNEYRAATGDNTVNRANWRTKKDFLIWVSTFMNTIYDIMYEPTALFNDDNYISQTTDDKRRFYLISDMSRALESYVYRDSFNKDEGKLKNYSTIAYWQSVGTTGDYVTRSTIKAIPISEGAAPASGEDTREVVNVSGVVGAIFSKWGVMVNAQQLETGAVTNDFDKWTNYIHQFEAGYFVDTGENCAVFVIGDDPETITIESESNSTHYDFTNKTANDMQSNLTVDGFDFKGTLKFISGGLAQSGPLSGDGYFMAIKFTNIPATARAVYVGLDPSVSSGLVALDSDHNGVFKVTNKNQQKFIVIVEYTNGGSNSYTYNLNQLVLSNS